MCGDPLPDIVALRSETNGLHNIRCIGSESKDCSSLEEVAMESKTHCRVPELELWRSRMFEFNYQHKAT